VVQADFKLRTLILIMPGWMRSGICLIFLLNGKQGCGWPVCNYMGFRGRFRLWFYKGITYKDLLEGSTKKCNLILCSRSTGSLLLLKPFIWWKDCHWKSLEKSAHTLDHSYFKYFKDSFGVFKRALQISILTWPILALSWCGLLFSLF